MDFENQRLRDTLQELTNERAAIAVENTRLHIQVSSTRKYNHYDRVLNFGSFHSLLLRSTRSMNILLSWHHQGPQIAILCWWSSCQSISEAGLTFIVIVSTDPVAESDMCFQYIRKIYLQLVEKVQESIHERHRQSLTLIHCARNKTSQRLRAYPVNV